jgi:serine/threonine protein kinase
MPLKSSNPMLSSSVPGSRAYTKFHPKQVLFDEATSLLLLGEELGTGHRIVVKQPKAGCTQTVQELAILPTLSHPRIIKLKGVANCAHGEAPVFPYAPNGDLRDHVDLGPLPESTVKHIMFQLLHAVAYMHGRGVWHRDLKLENILVLNNDASSVVITDLGLAVRPNTQSLNDGEIGTFEYSSPEQHLNYPYSEKVDNWSLGIVMHLCLTGFHPFDDGQGEEELRMNIICSDFGNMEVPNGISDDAIDLMRGLLANNPDDRLSAQDALQHRWFDEVQNTRLYEEDSGSFDPFLEQF